MSDEMHLNNLYTILKINTDKHERTCSCSNCDEYFKVLEEIVEKIYERKTRLFDSH